MAYLVIFKHLVAMWHAKRQFIPLYVIYIIFLFEGVVGLHFSHFMSLFVV